MRVPTPSFYAEWRCVHGQPCLLHDHQKGCPPEKLLQAVWVQQRLKRASLRTTDGTPVTVLHPGFWNREAGPDFRGAIVQFGGKRPIEGDIEIDVLPSGWITHGHADNPDFGNVVMHVVWESRRKRTNELPTLELHSFLDSQCRIVAA